MQAQGRGSIVNVSSTFGHEGGANASIYAASKHAVEGWSDALAAEVGPLGIHVTCIEPGPFRTDWAGRSLRQTPSRISDYAATAGARLSATSQKSGTQAGDPARAGEAMIALADDPNPPRHLVLGAWGHDAVVERLKGRLAEIEAWRETAVGTDFPGA